MGLSLEEMVKTLLYLVLEARVMGGEARLLGGEAMQAEDRELGLSWELEDLCWEAMMPGLPSRGKGSLGKEATEAHSESAKTWFMLPMVLPRPMVLLRLENMIVLVRV